MTNAAVRPHRKAHPLLWLLVLVATAVVACLVFISAGVVRESGMEEIHSADAIVVFGALGFQPRECGEDSWGL